MAIFYALLHENERTHTHTKIIIISSNNIKYTYVPGPREFSICFTRSSVRHSSQTDLLRAHFIQPNFAMLLGSALWRDCLFFFMLAGDFYQITLQMICFAVRYTLLWAQWFLIVLQIRRKSHLNFTVCSAPSRSLFLVTFECFQWNNMKRYYLKSCMSVQRVKLLKMNVKTWYFVILYHIIYIYICVCIWYEFVLVLHLRSNDMIYFIFFRINTNVHPMSSGCKCVVFHMRSLLPLFSIQNSQLTF